MGAGACVASQTTVLCRNKFNQTESPILVIFYYLYFQRQSLLTFMFHYTVSSENDKKYYVGNKVISENQRQLLLRGLDTFVTFSFTFYKGDILVLLSTCFPTHKVPSEKKSTLKGKNLLKCRVRLGLSPFRKGQTQF